MLKWHLMGRRSSSNSTLVVTFTTCMIFGACDRIGFDVLPLLIINLSLCPCLCKIVDTACNNTSQYGQFCVHCLNWEKVIH